jgi:hypothetical protein
MASRTAQAGLQATGGVASSTYANSVAGGLIGYIQRTTNAGPVSGAASDIGALSITFTANPNRMIELEFWCSAVASSDSTTYGQVLLVEGSNVLAYANTGLTIAGIGSGPAVVVRYLWSAPSSGSHTVKGQLARAGGAGSVTIAAGTDRPMFISVRDSGPAF